MGFIIRNISAGTVMIDDLGIELVNPNDEANLNQEAGQDIAISTDLPALVSASAIVVLDPLDDSTPLSIADGLEVISNANAPNYRIFGGALTQLDDVDLTGITNGQALVWSSSTMVASPVVTTVDGASGAVNLDTTYASITQGDVADTAVQPGDNISELINDSGYLTNITSESLNDLSDVTSVPADAGQVLQYNGTSWVNVDSSAIGGSGAFQLSWRFSTATNASDPGNKTFKYNSGTAASVTAIYFNDVSDSGVDASTLLDSLKVGDKIYIQQTSDASTAILFTVVSVVDNTGWFTINVSVDSASSTVPGNNQVCSVVLMYGIGGSGIDQLTGDVTAGPGNGSQVASIANSAVTNAKLRDSASLSVIGRTANSVGIPGDIVAGTDGFVLRRSGSALTFGTVATAGISNSAITNAKLANVATGTLKGRVTAGTGAPTDLTAAQVRTLLNVADGAAAAQNLWLNIAADTGGTATANTTTDTLTLAGGTGITTTRSGDTITINSSDAVISVDGRTGVVTLGDLYATFAQGATADTALQPGDDVSDLVNDAGYITLAQVPADAVDSVFGRTGIVIAQAGDYSAFYATTAQGTLADSAVQPGDDVSDLVNDAGYITIGDVPAAPVTSVDGRTGVVTLDDLYATFAQGATADTAVQPGDDVSDLNNDANYTSTGDNISVFVNDAGYITSAPVDSVFGRTGAVVAQAGDYSAFYATTAQGTLADSAVQPGDNVSDLVNDAGYITSAPVDSVFGRTGAVVAVDGDYDLTELGDVTITTPASDQVLTYNGTTWVNAASSATAGPLPALQIRRSTQLNPLPTTWTDFAFDTVDLQNDTSVIEWDPSNTDRVLIKQDGLYEITYNGVADDEFDGRIRINDTTVIPGSLKEVGDKADVNQVQTQGSVAVLANLTAGDFLTFQVDTITDAEFMLAGTTMSVKKLQGTKGDKGDQGDPGVGSSILVEDEGVTVPNGPFTTLDFVGAGVTTTGAAGTATVTIPGGAAAKQVFMSHNGVGTQTIGGTYVTVQPGTVVRSDTIYSYSAGLVTINKTGWFHVEVENSYSGGNARMTSTTRLIRNGTEIPGSLAYGYHRNNSDGDCTSATSTVINITSGDTVGSQGLGSSTMTTISNGCRLTITELDDPS